MTHPHDNQWLEKDPYYAGYGAEREGSTNPYEPETWAWREWNSGFAERWDDEPM